MSGPVYSVCFLAEANLAGLITWAVPAGHTAVLRDMRLWVRDPDPPATIDSLITVALDADDILVWDVKSARSMSTVYRWEGREVFTGYIKLVVPNAFAHSFRACGYNLTP